MQKRGTNLAGALKLEKPLSQLGTCFSEVQHLKYDRDCNMERFAMALHLLRQTTKKSGFILKKW